MSRFVAFVFLNQEKTNTKEINGTIIVTQHRNQDVDKGPMFEPCLNYIIYSPPWKIGRKKYIDRYVLTTYRKY